jgi:hypothetical protein
VRGASRGAPAAAEAREAAREENEQRKIYEDFIAEIAKKDHANAAAGTLLGGDGEPANDSDADEFAA